MTDMPPLDPADALDQLGRVNLGKTDLNGVLQLVADLAKRTVPGAHEVSVTLLRGEKAHTAVFTGALALALDEWQYEDGDGPCLTASVTGATFSLSDLADERRWPAWAGRARKAGLGSSLSIGLPVYEAVRGGLNVYAAKPHAFDDEAITQAQTFAEYAAVALANAHLYDATATLAEQMKTAMASRAVIEQAKGIIMGDRRCSADEAFQILTKLSRDTNRRVRDVAATLVERAAKPPGS
jgi:GAF domain-containing protein